MKKQFLAFTIFFFFTFSFAFFPILTYAEVDCKSVGTGDNMTCEDLNNDKRIAESGCVCTDLIEGMPENVVQQTPGVTCYDWSGPNNDICKTLLTPSGLGGIQSYVAMIYTYASWAIVTLAVLMLIVSGVQMSMGGASADAVTKAKTRIFQIIGGLVLFFMIGVILRTINPTFFT